MTTIRSTKAEETTDSTPAPFDPVIELIQENKELTERLNGLSWELRAIKSSSAYGMATKLGRIATRLAPEGGIVRRAARKLIRRQDQPAPASLPPTPIPSPQQAQPASNNGARDKLSTDMILRRPATATAMPVHCFTTLTANQLPKARVLAKSLQVTNPGWMIHAVMPEPLAPGIVPADEPFASVVTIDDLGIENLKPWLFKHNVVEAANAVKGAGAVHLFQRHGMDRLIYLDSDMAVLSDLSPIARLLDDHPIILTPHASRPETDPFQVRDKEFPFARYGVFNLGFFAVRADGQGADFINWWWARLRDHCYIEMKDGLFVDQRWCDLAPQYFDQLYILRDTRYNVASWNLTHREMSVTTDGALLVDGKPIGFYHFSGFDSGITRQSIRLSVPDERNVVYDLLDWYAAEVEKAGQAELSKIEWAYSRFSNGQPIVQRMRVAYRSRPELETRFPDPFDASGDHSFLAWWNSVAD